MCGVRSGCGPSSNVSAATGSPVGTDQMISCIPRRGSATSASTSVRSRGRSALAPADRPPATAPAPRRNPLRCTELEYHARPAGRRHESEVLADRVGGGLGGLAPPRVGGIPDFALLAGRGHWLHGRDDQSAATHRGGPTVTDLMDTALGGIGQLPLWAVLVAVCLVMALETTMLVGETVGYAVGRRWGPRLRKGWAGARLGEERWARAADVVEQRGGRAVFAARYLAAIHALMPIVAGTMGMRYRRFIAWCAAGGLTWSALYVTVRAVAGASWRHYADGLGTATRIAVGGLAGAAGFVGGRAIYHRLASYRRLRLHWASPARASGGSGPRRAWLA